MRTIDLMELEEERDIKIELYDNYLTIYNGNHLKIEYDRIVSHRYLGIRDHVYSSYTKALFDLINLNCDFIIEEIENRLKEYEENNEN